MDDQDDSTRVRNQPAIRSGTRRRWLMPAGLLAAITVALLIAALCLQAGVAAFGIVAVTALYLAMIVVGAVVRDIRSRNIALAWLMIALALSSLGALLLLLARELAQR